MKKIITYIAFITLFATGYANADSLGGGIFRTAAERLKPVVFANLGAPVAGSVRWCSDCAATSPCTGSGSGAFAYREGAAWNCNSPAGTGDIDGPASATDNAVVRFDGTTGKLVQNSVVIVGDTGATSGVSTLETTGNTGIGVAPSGVNGMRLLITQNGDQNTIAQVTNSEAAGTSAFAQFKTNADVAAAGIVSHGSGRTVSRWGEAIGGWNEILASGGDGLALGTSNAAPTLLGTGGQGRLYFSGGAKTLTESSATGVVDISLASNTVCGGTFRYTIQSSDATPDHQALRGEVQFTAVNKAGALTITDNTVAGVPANAAACACSAGTLTATFTTTAGASKFTLNLNAVSSLTQTTLNVRPNVVLDGGGASTTCNATFLP